jgi:hypothetical protein
MLINDLSYLQSVESSHITGSTGHGYSKNFSLKVYVRIDQDADGGKAYAKAYHGDAIADSSASNSIKVEF